MTTIAGQPPQEGSRRLTPHRMLLLEGVTLLLAAPFLLLPEAVPIVTIAALAALGIVWALSLLVSPPPSTPFDFTFLLWCIVLLIGLLVTADKAETLPKATGLILGLGVWRYTVLAANTRRNIGLSVGSLLLLGVGFSLVGILGLQELPKIPLIAELNPFSAQSLPGLGGLTIHPNQLAGLICLYLPLLVSLIVAPPPSLQTHLWRLLLIILTLLVLAILIFTQSRGGWIASLAGLFALLFLWILVLPRSPSRRFLRLVTIVIIIACVLIVAWIGPGEIRDLWLNPPDKTVVGTLQTLNYRKDLWPWAVTAVADFPFTGVGLGAFREVGYRLYPLPISLVHDIGHAHNIFLQTALDVGLPGLVVYLAILMVAAAAGWRAARRDAGFRSVSLGLLAGLTAVHVFGLADALALGSKPGVIFWFMLGILAAMNKKMDPVHLAP